MCGRIYSKLGPWGTGEREREREQLIRIKGEKRKAPKEISVTESCK